MGRRAASFGVVDADEAPPRPFSGRSVRISKVPKATGISRSQLYEWMRSGQLPWSRPAKERLVCRKTIAWLLRKHMGK